MCRLFCLDPPSTSKDDEAVTLTKGKWIYDNIGSVNIHSVSAVNTIQNNKTFVYHAQWSTTVESKLRRGPVGRRRSSR